MTLILSGTNGLSDVDGDASTPAVRGTDANTGIFFPAADTIAFAEGGVEAMRIDSSGNVGIGVTPSAWNSSQWSVFEGAYGGALAFFKASNVPVTVLTSNAFNDATGWKYKTTDPALQYEMDGNGGTYKWFQAASGTAGDPITFTQAMTLDASGNVGIGTSSPASDARLTLDNGGSGSVALMFRRSGSGEVDCAIQNDAALVFRAGTDSSTVAGITERARITSGGDLLVGTTTGVGSGRQELIVGGNAGGTYIGLGRSGTNAANIQLDSGDNLSIQNTASQPINVVATTNGVTLANGGTSWGAFSDERKKDIIEPITNAAEKVSSLRAVIGKYKTEEDGIRRSMLIAQDVQAVLPEAVVENNDGDLILHYTDTIPLLVAAIKELKAELDTVKAELATLKG
jgi:hypothetical protein